jgi:FkbM family methyltransferase
MNRLHYHAGDLMFYVRTNTLDIDCIKAVFDHNIYLPKKFGFSLKHGDTVVDLGAYIGDFSLYARQRGARVIAVEPFEDNYKLLLENMELNEMPVEHCAYAISDKRELKVFYINRGNYGGCGFNPDYRIENQEKINVNSITLKELFDNYNIEKCALLKFDTEGAELTYFDDFPYFDRVEQITGECPSGEIVDHLTELFTSKGYKINWASLTDDSETVIYAKRA